MAVAGYLTYSTDIDKTGFNTGLSSLESGVQSSGTKIKNIVTALGIDKIISATFTTLSNSVSGAIERLDTLNAYPKVMANLGFSTDEANASMEKLSSSIDGLPTALDEIVSNTQQMALSLGDLDYATDLTIALNDAILTFGGSSEDVTNDITQLNQMISAGTYDQQSWLAVNSSAPGLLNKVAESILGASANQADLRTALNDGTVSTEEFLQTFITLDQEGSDSITAFSESVKDATGGIGTALKNYSTRIKNGMAEIIKSLSNSLEEAGFGNLEDIISNAGTKAKEILFMVAEKIPDILELLEKIAPILVTIVASITAYKAELLIIDGIQFAKKIAGTVTTFLSLATTCRKLTDVMDLLNVTFMANPIMLIVAAVVALVAGFVYLWNTSEGFRSFWIELWENLKSAFEIAMNAVITFFTETIPNAFTEFVEVKLPAFINSAIEWFEELPYNLGYLIGVAIGHIIQFGIDAWNWVVNDLPQIIQGIINWFKELPGKIWEWLKETINKIVEWGKELVEKGKTAVTDFIDNVQETIKNLPDKFKELGKNIVDGLWNGIKNAKDWIVGKVKEFANGILDGMKSTLGINSPSKVFKDEVGKFIPQGIAVGIDANTEDAIEAIDNMNDEIMSEMNKAVAYETGSINANASVKSNNSMLNVIQATFNVEGNVEMSEQKVGRLVTPYVTKTIKTGGIK